MMQTSLGVSHRGGWISVDRPKVAAPFDQQMPDPPPLPHADQGRIDRHIPVGMEITHCFTDDFRTLHRLAVRLHSQAVHRIQNPALGWLQPVASIWQSTGNNDRHRVVEERLLHLVGDIDRNNFFFGNSHDLKTPVRCPDSGH